MGEETVLEEGRHVGGGRVESASAEGVSHIRGKGLRGDGSRAINTRDLTPGARIGKFRCTLSRRGKGSVVQTKRAGN